MKPVPKIRTGPAPKHASGADEPYAKDGPPGSTEVSRGAVGPTPSEVRQWARENGFEVGVRGRLHQEVLDAYMAVHPEVEDS